MIELEKPTPWLSLFAQGGNHVQAVKDGLMLPFPAGISHFVHPYRGEAPRASVMWEFEVETPED